MKTTTPTAKGLPIDIDLDRLMESLVRPSGVEIRDRFHRLKRYPKCFLGSELVDWIERERGINREAAIRIGRRLLALDKIAHVEGEHDFKDLPLFFRVCQVNEPNFQADVSIGAVRDLVAQMRGREGLPVGVRRRWLVNYPMSFSGAEVVDWICAQTGLQRREAAEVGIQMLSNNMIRHVFDTRAFLDSGHLYRFV